MASSTPDLSLWLGLYRRRTPGVRRARRTRRSSSDDFGDPQPDRTPAHRARMRRPCAVNEENYLTGTAGVGRGSRSDPAGRSTSAASATITSGPASGNTSSWPSIPTRSTGTSAAANKLVRIDPDPDGLYRSIVFPGLWLDPAALLRETSSRGHRTPSSAAWPRPSTPLRRPPRRRGGATHQRRDEAAFAPRRSRRPRP